MRTIKKSSFNKLAQAYSLALVAMEELEAADEDCDGFDEFNDAYMSLERVIWHLHHTVYVADKRRKEKANERNRQTF